MTELKTVKPCWNYLVGKCSHKKGCNFTHVGKDDLPEDFVRKVCAALAPCIPKYLSSDDARAGGGGGGKRKRPG